MQLDDAATILAHADFFEVCTQDERRLLAFASERKKYRPGSVIYEAGEVPDGAHVLVSGTVSTTIPSSCTSRAPCSAPWRSSSRRRGR